MGVGPFDKAAAPFLSIAVFIELLHKRLQALACPACLLCCLTGLQFAAKADINNIIRAVLEHALY